MLDPLISKEQIDARVLELGAEIRHAFPEDEPLLMIGVLKGSVLFLADLCRAVEGDVRIEFLQVRSYGDERTSSGQVQIVKDLDTQIEGKNVLIVEDIVDTGLTLSYLVEQLSIRKPKMLKIAALLRKPDAAKVDVTCDFVGFEISNQFVVGYGLDDAGRYRQLSYVAVLRSEVSS